jgi:hypothetical protein
VDRELFAVARDYSPLNYVLQLTDVSRPLICPEQIQSSPAYRRNPLPKTTRAAINQILGQEWNVVRALAQCGQANREDVEAVQEILPKSTFTGGRIQIPVRGREHAHIRGNSLRSAHPLEFPLLEHSQQCHLRIAWQFADLVQEEGSTVRAFEATQTSLQGAGKCSPLMPEELRDEILRLPHATATDSPGWTFLPRTSLRSSASTARETSVIAEQRNLCLSLNIDRLKNGNRANGGSEPNKTTRRMLLTVGYREFAECEAPKGKFPVTVLSGIANPPAW